MVFLGGHNEQGSVSSGEVADLIQLLHRRDLCCQWVEVLLGDVRSRGQQEAGTNEQAPDPPLTLQSPSGAP